MQAEGTPGLAIALTDCDHLLGVRTFGLANIDAARPVTPETRFEIGSISKSFTAIALLQLRDEGRFDPRLPVSRYLPWFRINSTHATLTGHDLLTHTAGLPGDRDDVPSSVAQAYELRDRITGSAPGAYWSYSNIGYQVLGYLLETIEHQQYDSIIRRRILEPLGMHRTAARFTNETRPSLAVGYSSLYDDRPTRPSDPLVTAPWIEYAAGDGSIVSTAEDLAAYVRMLLSRGRGPNGPLLSDSSFALLTAHAASSSRENDDSSYYGYGIFSSRLDGHPTIGHSGEMLGYTSQILAEPGESLGVVVFVNGPGDPGATAEFALGLFDAARHGRPLPELPAMETPTHVDNPGEYRGTYTSTDGRSLTLEASGDSLTLVSGDTRVALERESRDAFLASLPEFRLFPLRFERTRGDVTGVSYGGAWYAGARYTGPRTFAHPARWTTYAGHYRIMQPWEPNFRVVLRNGKLLRILPEGGEEPMTELSPGFFRVGDLQSAERLRFDQVVEGHALRAELSGMTYYRFFTE